MFYSYGRFLLPHLPLDRDGNIIKLGDNVALEYYRLERVTSGSIELKEGDIQGVKPPTDIGTAKAKDEKAPLSEIIEVLNERFGTEFNDADRLFFEQIKAKATANELVIKTANANEFDKFQLGIRKLLEDLFVERMADNDKIVTRYMADPDFQAAAFPHLAKAIYEAIRGNGTPEQQRGIDGNQLGA